MSTCGGEANTAVFEHETNSIGVSGIEWNLETSANPAHLPEITRLEMNTASTGSLLSGGASPGRKTMKDMEHDQRSLEEENFQLKLRVYMLEERLQGKLPTDKSNEVIVELKLATLRDELAQKKGLLRCASETLEKMEKQCAAEMEQQQQQLIAERTRHEERVQQLETQLEQISQERTAALADRSVAEQPYLKAFEPLAVDHAACRSQRELNALEERMSELQQALSEMKETMEASDAQTALLRRQLAEYRAACARLTQRAEASERQCAAERTDAAQGLADAHQLHEDRCHQLQLDTQQLTEQLQQCQQQLTQSSAEVEQLQHQPDTAAALIRLEELQRTCDQLTAGRAADGTRLGELELTVERANQKIAVAATNEATLTAALHKTADELAERKVQLTEARGEHRRSAARILALIDEQRELLKLVKHKSGVSPPDDGRQSVSPLGSRSSDSTVPTPHEVQVYLLRTETQRKDKKIRSMVTEMKEMNDMLMKYRWEVKEVAEEENERLWTELEENKKLIKELQDEKMELVMEKERQIQRLLAQLKEREPVGAGSELQQQLDQRDCHLAASGLKLRQARDQQTRLRAETDRAAAGLQEAQTQVQSLRSQLAHATLLVAERDSASDQLRERLLQQRSLLDEPLPAPQLRQRLGTELEHLCAELAAPRPGPVDVDALGGAGEMGADSSESAATNPDDSELDAQKVAALRQQAVDLRQQAVDLRQQLEARDRLVAEAEERAAAAGRLRAALDECQRQLSAADQRLAELAPLPERLNAAEHRLVEADRQLVDANRQLAELVEVRATLEARERELTLAEGQLNEIDALREQVAARDHQLAAAAGQRRELQQVRQLLTERADEKAALLRHLDEQRREHEREARALCEKYELTVTAPTWHEFHEAAQRHETEQKRLRRRLAESRSACQLLQRRLEELADFMELLLGLEERGVLDLSCLTAQHMADLQRSVVESRELSQSLTQSLMLGLDEADSALDASDPSLHAPLGEQSSLHVPDMPEQSSLHMTDLSEQSSLTAADRRQEPTEVSAGETAVLPSVRKSVVSTTPGRQGLVGDTLAASSKPAAVVAKSDDGSDAAPSVSPAPLPSDTGTPAMSAPSPVSPVSTTDSGVQSTRVETVEHGQQASETNPLSAEAAVQEASERLDSRTARLQALSEQLESRDTQLQLQAQLIDELHRQLEQRPVPTDTAQAPTDAPGADPEMALAGVCDSLPGDVRDRFRWLVRRQRTSDRVSGAETGCTVERALSPILGMARAQSAELLRLEPTPVPAAQLSRSADRLGAASAPPSDDSETVRETRRSPRANRSQLRPLDASLPPPSSPPPGDFSESEAWSEPDRDVSLARIGLDQSSLGTRTESWLGVHSDSEARRSRRRQKIGPQEVQELETHIESLQQVKNALRAEVDIYQKVLPASGRKAKQTGVMVPTEVLAEIHSLQQQLERAIAANERIRQQLELSPRRTEDDAHDQFTLELKATREELAEANDTLAATQQRCDDLRFKLNRAKENLRLAQLNAEQFKDKFVRVSDDLVGLRERFNQIEADRERSSEDGWRRQRDQQEGAAVRRLERQLERAGDSVREKETLVQQLQSQLLQQLPPADEGDKENAPQPLRTTCSESQLLVLNREKLRLLSERKLVAARGRLLRSESCLLDGDQHQVDVERRLEAAKWAGWETERERLQADNARLRDERGRLRRQLVTSGTEAGRAARRRLQTEADTARAAEARLTADHAHCEHRLVELGRQMQADKQRLVEVSAQLEEVNSEMESMRLKLNELDDVGQCWPESTRSCDLQPVHPTTIAAPAMTEPTRHANSESDGHDGQHESDRTSGAYSSPDLGIESDCNRRLSSPPSSVRRDDEPEPAASENELLRLERDQMHTKLAATRAALQVALDKLTRADQRKARVERAIYRQLSKTHDILRRAKNNLAPPPPAPVAPPDQ